MSLLWMLLLVPASVKSAPYAAMVMDARTGEVLHARNADTRLHPASLTKMMTLYVVFQAVQNGEITMDTRVRVSKKAAAEPPSKLGLKPGQRIKLRYLVRAAAVRSANDASTAIAEAISGSEAAFARRMNRTAKQLGMTRTTFKNAHGLTETGHMSTARDMTILGRHVIYDYPQYYNLFSRKTADAGVRHVSHTNSRLLSNYKGADGIKTGYTRAAGFNLVASAERGRERVLATVFGGRSTATRNARVAELLDMGFKRAPTRVALRKPKMPAYRGPGPQGATLTAKAVPVQKKPGSAGKTLRVVGAVKTSLRPQARAVPDTSVVVAAVAQDLNAALEATQALAAAEAVTEAASPAVVEAVAVTVTPAPTAPTPEPVQVAATPAPQRSVKPSARPAALVLAATGGTAARAPEPQRQAVQEVVTRLSTSGGRHWGVTLGRYPSRFAAEKVLLKTALAETSVLSGGARRIVKRSTGFEANFTGLSREDADLACRRLQSRGATCFMVGPAS
ncbi:D-alanyl-D-alanine carboxypeptidase family protein [Pseudaestuariivita sp.]|uniref:D-alanyl-D-alanine carboxypeptidase family protein n=1 Tax=Pseudaestuariivita sp. TaxID=2211669 RepID=UPI0040599AE0